MRDPQEQIVIRDYLNRKRWYYIGGGLIHVLLMIAACFSDYSMLIGIIGGSAIFLSFELMRGGGSATARTLLSMPITKQQLARSWRFVALELPIVLYLAALLVGCGLGTLFGGDKMTAERLIIIALLQSGMLGTLFFALTGMQVAPSPGDDLAQRGRAIFFGLLWGASIPAVMFLMNVARTGFEDLGPGHVLAGGFLLGATVAGWFRAETLVARRASGGRAGNKRSLSANARPRGSEMPWRGFGGLPFFFAFFGRVLSWLFVFMLIFIWVIFEFFLQLNSRVDRDGGASEGQTSMFIAIVAMISIFQVIPSLRLLRTMPLRLSTITHFLVFWPLALTSILGLAAYLAHSALFGGALDWSRYITGIASCTLVMLGLPLILRFGIGVKTLIPICLLLGVAQSMTIVSGERFDLLANWLPIVAGLIAIVAIVWRLTFKALQSPNPWRANLLKMFSMRQTM